MKKPSKRNFRLSGHVSFETEKKIRKVIEESGESIQLEEAAIWEPITEYDIFQVINAEYTGKENNLQDVVDVPAIIEKLNSPDARAWQELHEGVQGFVRCVVKDWIWENRPELASKFLFCMED